MICDAEIYSCTERERKKETVLYLPGGSVSPEVAEGVLEPVVDLVQRQLLVWGLDDGLKGLMNIECALSLKWRTIMYLSYERCIREGRSHIG